MTLWRSERRRVEFGDWQTPLELARAAFAVLQRDARAFSSILEPTCGLGSFLVAGAECFPSAALVGFDVSEAYVSAARERLSPHSARVELVDFFAANWETVLDGLREPILIAGNPPWVTNAGLGALGAANSPVKTNAKGMTGLDALTGKSNFDISEWMLVRLLEAARGRDFELAMLCKSSVARRVIETAAHRAWPFEGELRAIDASRHFGVAVAAVLLRVRPSTRSDIARRWSEFSTLEAREPSGRLGVVDGRVCADVDGLLATRGLEGRSEIIWRSGIKHDCAAVMELTIDAAELKNGLGESVAIEPERLYPFLKGSDLGNARRIPRKRLVVTQHRLGEDTRSLATTAPKTWRYLEHHAVRMAARKSRIYAGQAPFALFGVGEYAFAPFKVALCGLYKRLVFTVIEPIDGQPVLVDDTCYFLPCSSRNEAEAIAEVLNGEHARRFFEARVFWDAKRPLGKALLSSLSLAALFRAHGKTFPSTVGGRAS